MTDNHQDKKSLLLRGNDRCKSQYKTIDSLDYNTIFANITKFTKTWPRFDFIQGPAINVGPVYLPT